MVVTCSNLGFPRIGAQRELKKWVEAYWKNTLSSEELFTHVKQLRAQHWQLQHSLQIDTIPSNDFSLYDHVLDHLILFNAIPPKYQSISNSLDQYFAMARGLQTYTVDVEAMEMKKWFDTNYHYIVGQFSDATEFKLTDSPKPIQEFLEAKALNIHTRPVLLGPITFLALGQYFTKESLANKVELAPSPSTTTTLFQNLVPNAPIWSLLDKLIPAYLELFQQLKDVGVTDVQMDEPILVCSFPKDCFQYVERAYKKLTSSLSNVPRILLATYFEGIPQDLIPHLCALPIHALHLDLVRAPDQLASFLSHLTSTSNTTLSLSLGLVNGRNIWKTNLQKALESAKLAMSQLGTDRVSIAPSCSLLHTPVSLEYETELDSELKSWLSFAKEKLIEIRTLAMAFEDPNRMQSSLNENAWIMNQRQQSTRIHVPETQQRLAQLTSLDFQRAEPFSKRWMEQQRRLQLPLFPTTTIGSFPQTPQVRFTRAKYKQGKITASEYQRFLEKETKACIEFQESIGLDVLVHGEFERNDMVEYFGELLQGYAFTKQGWIQSYGTRCVKPPILYGDIVRRQPMTVHFSTYAQSCTSKPVKGMLTGPVTLLQWSFVRDDQPKKLTAFQLALALRDEVLDLERAGLRVIQMDEPAIREGLPLHRSLWSSYLDWAVQAFLLATSGVQSHTQIQSHMCYSDFDDIFEAILTMDVDVLLVENAKSHSKLLNSLTQFMYPRCLGPGVYDIHSPRIPSVQEMVSKLLPFLNVFTTFSQLWINPDCGLKTRTWEEVKPSLLHLCQVAQQLRTQIPPPLYSKEQPLNLQSEKEMGCSEMTSMTAISVEEIHHEEEQ